MNKYSTIKGAVITAFTVLAILSMALLTSCGNDAKAITRNTEGQKETDSTKRRGRVKQLKSHIMEVRWIDTAYRNGDIIHLGSALYVVQ